MNKIALFALFLIAVLLFWFFNWNRPKVYNATLTQSSSEKPFTNITATTITGSNVRSNATQPLNEGMIPDMQVSNDLFAAISATNIAQWRLSVKGLKNLGFTFDQKWLVEQPGRTNGLPLLLQVGDKKVLLKAALIELDGENITGNLYEVNLQSENMSIDDTRKLGLQLCDMYGCNSDGFLQWCDSVGNRWLDQPWFSGVFNQRFIGF